mmetsp:Transcript_1579/g.2417  ORF Transcript_1579/g.2417 Transcript_1579/m.2417 type:complete len:322 (-) Transcript_1579:1424-2389(-)|eukprot:CAMPEP_0194214050 /NCGR_PEP_ID=MMETSP0156-20130528/15094_1 /TAXON_ID=33649 /ORGANISM="Thalassionema nitzschioides, Strain L26-B" /LENGTH=321 /DNA_ID=CAMNT_0038942231 /DNA_START=36 /DNA_END=1001 /DNA_ORIENTATION=-
MPPSCYSTTPDLIDIDDASNVFDDNSLTSQEIENTSTVQTDREIQPHENDILMGRGGKNNQHIGNEKLRQLARGQSENYQEASKKGKSNISRDLVKQVRSMNPPGRFLKKDSKTGAWEDVGDDIAREKTSQVLRDAVSILLGRSSPNVYVEEADFEETPGEIPQSLPAPHFSTMKQPMKSRSWEEMRGNTPPQKTMSEEYYSSQSYDSNNVPPSKRTKYYIDSWDRSGAPWPYHRARRSIRFPVQMATTHSHPSQSHAYRAEQSQNPESVPSLKVLHKNAVLEEFDLFNGELLNSDTETDAEEDNDDGDVELKHGFWPVCV